MSPELVSGQRLSEKSDVYSLGMVIIEMITLEVPYADEDSKNNVIEKIREGSKPRILDRISDDQIKELILSMICHDPKKRPTVNELIHHEFMQINDKEDNRLVKLIKIKKKSKKKKTNNSDKISDNGLLVTNSDRNSKKWMEEGNKLNKKFPRKNYREDNQNYDDKFRGDRSSRENDSCKYENPVKNINLLTHDNSPFHTEHIEQIAAEKKEMPDHTHNLVVSSHEGGFTQYSKYNSDMYQTNTDYANFFAKERDDANPEIRSDKNLKNSDNDSFDGNLSSYNLAGLKNKDFEAHNGSHYQIFDSHYNVHLKFLINQDGKLHEIKFTYNLIRDNIPELMQEIQNEFYFSAEHLNHIYETLKKISIYSKFYKNSDILHDNSF